MHSSILHITSQNLAHSFTLSAPSRILDGRPNEISLVRLNIPPFAVFQAWVKRKEVWSILQKQVSPQINFGKHAEETLFHVEKCWEFNKFPLDILRYRIIRLCQSKDHESQEECKKCSVWFFPGRLDSAPRFLLSDSMTGYSIHSVRYGMFLWFKMNLIG